MIKGMDLKPSWPVKGIPLAAIAVMLFAPIEASRSADWTQYRGLNHDGVSTDRILTNWPASGPPRLWKVPLNGGHSSFTVSQGRAYTQVVRNVVPGGEEVCIALDAETGTELWATRVRGTGASLLAQPPYSTPTVDGHRVYVLSTDLVLFCLDAETGQVIWETDLIGQYNGAKLGYGNAASPTVDGDFVFVNCNARAGDRLLAFRKTDGSLAWKAAADQPEYATPIAATILGMRQVIFSTKSEFVSVVPESGAVLWRYATNGSQPYPFRPYATPVVAGDIVFAADMMGAHAVRIAQSGDNFQATQIWSHSPNGTSLGIEWSTPVCHDGYLYGLFLSGDLKCVELATGKVMWSRTGFGRGGILVVDGRILILTDRGQLVLVEANPGVYTRLASFQALTGECWNHPAICDGRIYARSTKQGVCLDVAEKPLRLQPPSRQTNGSFQLLVADVTGSGLPPYRLGRVEILATPDLSFPLTNWVKLTNTTVLTNGMLQLNDPEGAQLQQRFFMGVERR